jgi:drug/metabolite transporter (DMT)-like permease
MPALPRKAQASGLRRRLRTGLRARSRHWSPAARGLLWAVAAGILFALLNGTMRTLAQRIDPFQTQFLRYFCALLLLLPLVWARGPASYRPQQPSGHFTRGALHTAALSLWFFALPHMPLADMTAIGFTSPLFVMLGAYLFLHEPMHWERWVATVIGFGGVLVVVGPKLWAGDGSTGLYHLAMLGAAPLFAASFLLTKTLTRVDNTGTILVWQALTISIFSLPMALLHWQDPSPVQWLGFLLCGLIGNGSHYCLTRSLAAADVSATQSAKFLDLVWSGIMGWLLFSEVPGLNALVGGCVISAATLWVARRESRRPAPSGG